MTDDRVTSEGRADDPEGPTTGRCRVCFVFVRETNEADYRCARCHKKVERWC